MIKKKRKFLGGGGGAYVKFPLWWGYRYFLELHIWCCLFFYFSFSKLVHEDIDRNHGTWGSYKN